MLPISLVLSLLPLAAAASGPQDSGESGPLLLQRASVDDAKTWKFAPHTAGTFEVTYHYDFASSDAAAATSFPNSSDQVEVKVVVLAPEMIIEYAWIELGKWKADWTSPHGEWLDVVISGAPGEGNDDNVDYGRKDADFLAFTIKLAEPDGKPPKTYLVGKMSGNRIVGRFMDESGVRGRWTATRIHEWEKK